MKHRGIASLFLAGAVVLAGCADDASSPIAPDALAPSLSKQNGSQTGRFVIIGANGALPADLAARVTAAGGRLAKVFPEIGVAVASATNPAFESAAAGIAGIESVNEDVVLQWTDPNIRVVDFTGDVTGAAFTPDVASIGDDERFFPIQWAHTAVQTPQAWNAGHTGEGVRVAILDGGLYADHLDLSANVDRAASASFVPGTTFNQDLGTFWHGTHVAGIVAAGNNGIGAIGIAPNATLIGVKVLHGGSGAFEWVINGIMHAGRPLAEGGAGADIINMSLGATLNERSKETRAAARELRKAVDRATSYAYQQGVVVIASAGNGATNFDEARELLKIPAQNQHVISVAATGPLAWAYGETNFSRPSSYTDHGKSLVDLAAPGGDFAYPGNESCMVAGVLSFCWVFDMYLSTSRGALLNLNGGYSWAAGTSMAAPVTSGIAALIIGANGGRMHPAQVEAILRQGATDLGKPGNDEWYGHGWVNAYNSVR